MENLKGNTLLEETIWTKWEKTVQKTDSKVLGLAPDTFFSIPIFFCLWEKDKWPRFRIFQSLLRYRKESSVEIIEEQPREKMIKDFLFQEDIQKSVQNVRPIPNSKVMHTPVSLTEASY